MTWDVDIALRHLRTLGDNDRLSLRALSRKLAQCVVLRKGSENELFCWCPHLPFLCECCKCEVHSLWSESSEVQIQSLKLRSSAGIRECHEECVVQCLRQYEKVTKDIRLVFSFLYQALLSGYISENCPLDQRSLGGGRCGYRHF